MRGLPAKLALIACIAWMAGCANYRGMRLDPSGEHVFVMGPPAAACPAPVPVAPLRPIPVAAAPAPCCPPPVPCAVVDPDACVGLTLWPRRVVQPVGTEAVLVAGVRGGDGFYRIGERLEWSIAPCGCGHFVDLGRRGWVDILLGDFNQPRKVDNTYAVNSTLRRPVQLRSGSAVTEDVCVRSGQGWVSLTSPVEGTSVVTVFAPSVRCWDARKQQATIYWIDAQCIYPPAAINPAGSRHVLTTTVLRQTNQCPHAGWRVRYRVTGGPPAAFGRPDGPASIEAVTNTAGQASAELFQREPAHGTNTIAIQVIRPAETGGAGGEPLVVGNGSTLKTWRAAGLSLRAAGPAVAAVGATIDYRFDVSNSGDIQAKDVVVTDELPEGLNYLASQPPAELIGRRLQWRLGTMAPAQVQAIRLSARAVRPGSMVNCGEAAAEGLKSSDCVTTTVMASAVDVRVTGPEQVNVGGNVTFDIAVTNRSNLPASGLVLKDRLGQGLEHSERKNVIEKGLSDIAPGQTKHVGVTFRATQAGRLSHTVEVISSDGTRVSAAGEVTAVETAGPASPGPLLTPPAPAGTPLVVSKTAPPRATVGETARFRITISNTGTQALTNLQATDRYDAAWQPMAPNTGVRRMNNDLIWTIPSLPAGQTLLVDIEAQASAVASRATSHVWITSQEGPKAEAETATEIVAAKPADSRLSVAVVGLTNPVTAGRALTYEIRVANNGAEPETQVAVTADVPMAMVPDRLGGTSGPEGTGTKFDIEGRSVRFSPLAELRPGQTVSYRVHVLTQQVGRFEFVAKATSQKHPEPVSGKDTTEVNAPAPRLTPP